MYCIYIVYTVYTLCVLSICVYCIYNVCSVCTLFVLSIQCVHFLYIMCTVYIYIECTVSPVSYANVPANAQKYLRLCTGFPMGLNYRKMQGAQKVIMGKTQEGHAHFCPQSQI